MSKIGEIYQIPSLSPKRYFQFVAIDESQLGGHVLAILKFQGTISEKASSDTIAKIANSGVEFFTHTIVDAGTTNGLWSRIGKTEANDYNEALFKDVDYKGKLPDLEPYESASYHSWVIWRINGRKKNIGDRIQDYPYAELGAVFAPAHVVHRIENGKYPGTPYYGQEK